MNMINPDGGRISLSLQMQETRGFQSPPASGREPKEEMIRSLTDENSRLRQELESMKRKLAEKSPSENGNTDDSSFSYNMNTNTLTLNGFQTKDMLIRHLQAKVGNGDRIEKELQSSVGLTGMGGTDSNALAAQIKKAPLDVTEFSIQISSQDATKAVIGSKSADLEKEGIKNLNIAFEPGGRMTINGTLKKIIPIPFSLRGDISVTDDNRIRYEVKDINAGFLPLPDLIKTLAMSVAGGSFNDKSIEVSGDTFTLNTAAMMPDNIKAKPTRITTGDGFITVEG